MNKIILIGNIGHTPELKHAEDKSFLRFPLAVKDPYRNETDWFDCVSFGKQAETIANYFVKGSKIAVVGRVQTGIYEGNDGAKRKKFDVIVESFDFCDSKASGENQKAGAENELPYTVYTESDEDGDDLPF